MMAPSSIKITRSPASLANPISWVTTAIVMASTVGLEALLYDVPLGLLEIPGYGYIYDYVASGAAAGLAWNEPMAPQIQSLLSGNPLLRQRARDYLDTQIAHRSQASTHVEQLICRLVENSNVPAG